MVESGSEACSDSRLIIHRLPRCALFSGCFFLILIITSFASLLTLDVRPGAGGLPVTAIDRLIEHPEQVVYDGPSVFHQGAEGGCSMLLLALDLPESRLVGLKGKRSLGRVLEEFLEGDQVRVR